MLETLIALSFLPIFVLSLFVLFAIRRSRAFERKIITHQIELKRRMYELAILKEVEERIGYSLDVEKVVDIVTGSLRKLFPYSTASSVVLSREGKVLFKCDVSESVGKSFIKNVRDNMLSSLSNITSKQFQTDKIEEFLTGIILEEGNKSAPETYFNIPLTINEETVGLINISSCKKNAYSEDEMMLLFRITNQAAAAVSKLQVVLNTEKGKIVSMVSSMADGVIMTDRDIRLVVMNPAASSFLKIGEKDPTIFDVIDSLSGKLDIRYRIEESLRSQSLVVVEELFIDDKAVQVLISPVKDPEGSILGCVVLLQDITNEKKLERLRQDFTAMIVHELRAPLTAVKGTSDTLLRHIKELEAVKISELARLVNDSSSQMLGLVNDLLDVAKIEAGKFEVIKEKADLSLVVQKSINTFRDLAIQKGIGLSYEINPNVPVDLYFDPLRISQVLNNLISNALKFTNKGGVKIASELKGNFVQVSVADTGEGISEGEIKDLFNKYKQIDISAEKRSIGTGLGLVISKGIIESHEGKIWVESKISKGSTFYFNIPYGRDTEDKDGSLVKNRFVKSGKSL